MRVREPAGFAAGRLQGLVSTTSLKFVPGFYAGPRGWCLKASPAGARTGAHAPVFVDRSLRPNGPGDSSPGLRPEADALGKGAPHRCGLIGRENPARYRVGLKSSRGLLSNKGLLLLVAKTASPRPVL